MPLTFVLGAMLACGLVLGGCAGKGRYVEAQAYVAAQPTKGAVLETIRVGDSLTIKVFGEPNLAVDAAMVRGTGTIVLPLVGEQQVVGLTPKQLSQKITVALEPFVKDADVTVLLAPAPTAVHVMGEVGGGGRKEFKRPITITEVIAESGGLTQYANRKGIFVLRGGDRIRFNYTDILRGEAHVRAFYMKDGDVIVVE